MSTETQLQQPSTQLSVSEHMDPQQQEDLPYSSDSEAVDDELSQVMNLKDASKEFSPIKPNDLSANLSPHSTMYNSVNSHPHPHHHDHDNTSANLSKTTTMNETEFIKNSFLGYQVQPEEQEEEESQNLINVDKQEPEETTQSVYQEAFSREMSSITREDRAALESDGEDINIDELPETIDLLKSKDGSRTIYLVGTSHFSKQSHRDVRRIIRTVKPKVVMLELCRSRMCFLSMDEHEIMQEARSLDFGKIRDYIKRNGWVQGFIYTLLLTASAKVTNDLDMAPGGEFRNAFNEALKIPGCTIILGDRPVDITLRRAIATLSTWQKIKMTYNCLFSNEKLDEEELEKYKQKDVLEQLIGELSEEFPGLSRVMVTERDQYLAHSLYGVCQSTEPGATIVGVVGIGHSAGIKANWPTVENINIAQLIQIPQSKPSITGRVIKYGFYVLVGYGAYRYLLPRTVKSFLVETVGRTSAKVSSLLG